MTSDQIASLGPALAAHVQRFRHCFSREPTFGHLGRYVQGLLTSLDRKSIEPIALGTDVPPRTLQEFLSHLSWDHARAEATLHRLVADRPVRGLRIGVLDASGYPKQGDKTPGVQRQWCGQLGKVANCVVGQHLLWTDNDPHNPFSSMLCSDLFLPQSWAADRARCREAHIPDELTHRTKWRIGIEQLERALGNAVKFDWVTFDEDYGDASGLWFELDRLGLWGIGEARPTFRCWTTRPACVSLQAAHAARRVDDLSSHSPAFREQAWQRMKIKDVTRGACAWHIKTARVHLAMEDAKGRAIPTDRQYWLIVARQPTTGQIKYFVSNAPASADLLTMLKVAFGRFHIERWFGLAKQDAGLDAFEVRTYRSLIRHWLCSMIAMFFLAEQTTRLRGEKPEGHARTGQPCDERADQPDAQRELEYAP